MRLDILHMIASIIVVFGAIALGIMGFFKREIINEIVGPVATDYIYDVIGIAGLYLIFIKLFVIFRAIAM